MKKTLAAILVSALLGLSLLGCGQTNAPAASGTGQGKSEASTTAGEKPAASEKVTIRLMGYNNEEVRKPWLEYLKTKLPNIDIQYEFVELGNFNNLLNSQLQAGQAADIIEVGGEAKLLAKAGYLYDLTAESYTSQYAESGTKAYTLEGKIFALPMQSWFEGIYYNKRIFKENGIAIPKNLDQWIAVHKQLKEKGIKPQTMGAQSWEPMMKQSIGVVNNMFYSAAANKDFDQKFNTGEGKLAQAWLPAVTEWSRMISEGCLEPSMLGMTYDQAQEEFATEKAAMWESGPWALGALREKNPKLEIGMFPIPGKEESAGYLVGGPGSALAINAKSKNLAACLEVLKATATPEAQAALISANPGSSYLKGYENKLGPEFEDSYPALNEARVYAPWTSEWLVGNPVVEAYGKSLQEVLAGSKTVEQALKDADTTNENMLKTMS